MAGGIKGIFMLQISQEDGNSYWIEIELQQRVREIYIATVNANIRLLI